MLNFAWDGITSFSVKPIRLILSMGTIIFIVSLIVFVVLLICGYFGIYFAITSLWILGGIIMISLGVVGEYVGKIYNETKQRPRYIISEKLK